MASGAIVGQILNILPPATLFPQPLIRQGASTPAERVLVYSFDAATEEYLDFLVQLYGYDGGGLTITTKSSAATATTGNVRQGIAIRRIADDAEDIDTSHTYDYNEINITAPSASGETTYDDTTFTNGADMDSWANGEIAIVRVRREAGDVTNDTMTGDWELWAGALLIRET